MVDAIVLTGGRSSRLDSIPKSEFTVDTLTLLGRTLSAVSDAARIVVVGPEPSIALPKNAVLVREDPPFSGPLAAIAAGVAALGYIEDTSLVTAEQDVVMVLACDMPHIDLAVTALRTALSEAAGADGVIALDESGHRQPLAAIYRTRPLTLAINALAASDSEPVRQGERLAGLPVFRLIDQLSLVELNVAPEATADVDTWDDAKRLGAQPPKNLPPALNEGEQHG